MHGRRYRPEPLSSTELGRCKGRDGADKESVDGGVGAVEDKVQW